MRRAVSADGVEAAAVEDVASISVESSLRLSAAQHAARAARFSIFFASQRLDKDPDVGAPSRSGTRGERRRNLP